MGDNSDFKKSRTFPRIAITFLLGCIALFGSTLAVFEFLGVPPDYQPESSVQWTDLREQFVEYFDPHTYSIQELRALRELYPELRAEIDEYIHEWEVSESIRISISESEERSRSEEERSRSIEEERSRSEEAERSRSEEAAKSQGGQSNG